MTHKNINVSGLDVLIRPNHRMVAHLDVGVGLVRFFVHAGQDMNVGARGFVIGVKLFVVNDEWRGDSLHRRMVLVLDGDRSGDKGSDVILEAYSTQEIAEPRPYLETIELA